MLMLFLALANKKCLKLLVHSNEFHNECVVFLRVCSWVRQCGAVLGALLSECSHVGAQIARVAIFGVVCWASLAHVIAIGNE